MNDTSSDGSLSVPEADGVLDNDSDEDDEELTAHVLVTTSHGTLDLNEDGSFTYDPDDGFHGEDTFTYRAYDGTEYSDAATVTITVNDPPLAMDDAYDVDEDGTLTIDAPGVLEDDTDADGDTLTMKVITHPVHGTLTPNADGSFTYKPNANYHGDDMFTYVANDGYADSATATVTITVHSVNDAPVAVADEYETDQDVKLTVAAPGVLANDTDVEGDSLTAVISVYPSHGSVTPLTDGSFEYTPDAGFTGVDTFKYTVNDGSLEYVKGLCAFE